MNSSLEMMQLLWLCNVALLVAYVTSSPTPQMREQTELDLPLNAEVVEGVTEPSRMLPGHHAVQKFWVPEKLPKYKVIRAGLSSEQAAASVKVPSTSYLFKKRRSGPVALRRRRDVEIMDSLSPSMHYRALSRIADLMQEMETDSNDMDSWRQILDIMQQLNNVK